MRCPDCGSEMIELFTSVYCPVCEEVTEEIVIDDEDWGDEIGPFELDIDGYIVPMKNANLCDAGFVYSPNIPLTISDHIFAPGDDVIKECIDDIIYVRKRIFSALKIPKEYW